MTQKIKSILLGILKDTEYNLSLFTDTEIQSFESSIVQKSGKYYINCIIRNREVLLRPEEIVRQLYTFKLINEYPKKHLGNYFPSDNFWEDPESIYTTDDFIKGNKQYLLQADDIILYSVGAYIGKTNIYNSKIKATIGSFLTLIRPDHGKINPYYLLVFFNSEVGKQMTRRCSRGMAQQYVYPYDIRKFVIPIIPKSKQTEIEKKMLASLDAKALSKRLLEIAKRGVEMAIEKSEKDAQKWIESEINKAKIA